MVADRCDYPAWYPNGRRLIHRRHYSARLGISGTGLVQTTAGEVPLNPGDLLLCRPGDLLETRQDPAGERWIYDWIAFLPPVGGCWLTQPATGAWPLLFAGIEASTRAQIAATMLDLRHWFCSAVPLRHELLANNLERLLLLIRLLDPGSARHAIDPRLRRVVLHMQQALASSITVRDLATQAGLSTSRFIHVFSEAMGMPPLRYLEGLRLAKACQLLAEPGLSIGVIAARVGIPDQFHFSRRFTARYAHAPSRWRQRRYGLSSRS